MRSNVVKEEDAEIYIYGINQILVSVFNVSSALIIGWIFGVILEIAVFMAAYIPLRTFAGGYHAKTPLRCYLFSVIMLISISMGIRYFCIPDLVCYIILTVSTVVVLFLSPIEDRNKPLNKTEQRVYKRRTTFIVIIELIAGIAFKLMEINGLFAAVLCSFSVLCVMLYLGVIKNFFNKT